MLSPQDLDAETCAHIEHEVDAQAKAEEIEFLRDLLDKVGCFFYFILNCTMQYTHCPSLCPSLETITPCIEKSVVCKIVIFPFIKLITVEC